MKNNLVKKNLTGQEQFRIIPSIYPPINFFEDLVDPDQMDILWEIESRTNDRLREEAGDIYLIAPEDRVVGHGSSVVMAAFTHVGKPSRFTDGSYGVYYAGLSLETAINETKFHRENFLKATNEAPKEITMRAYKGKINKPLHDICGKKYTNLHNPSSYIDSVIFGRGLREKKSWGLIYNSVRHKGGKCIAAFRPPAISIPEQTSHLRYVWDGKKISHIFYIDKQPAYSYEV